MPQRCWRNAAWPPRFGTDLTEDSQTTPAERKRAFSLLFLCLVVVGIGNSLLFAILPPIARQLGIAEVYVGLVYTLAATLVIVTSPIWGKVSDRIGRKPVVVLGLATYCVSMTGMAVFVSLGLAGTISAGATIVLLMLSRSLFGGIGSATGPAAQAYVADRTSTQARTEALAGMTAAIGLGAAIGPGVAAWLGAKLGLVAPLAIVAGLAATAATASWFLIPERTPPQQTGARPGVLRTFAYALDGRVSPFLIFGVAIWIVQAVTLQTLNFFVMDTLEVEGVDATQLAGTVLMSGALAMLISQLVIIPRLHASPRTLMIAGACLAFGANLLLAISHTYGEIVFAFVVSGLGIGLSRPGMAGGASVAVSPSEQGAVAGLVNSCAGVGFLSAPVIGLLVYQTFGPSVPYWINVAILAAAGVYAALSPRIKAVSNAASMPPEETHDPL